MSTPFLALFAEIITAPLLLRQGRRLRRGIPRLPEPDGARAGTIGKGAPLRVMVIGDSAAAGVGVATQAEALSGQLAAALADTFTVSWQLHARTGYTTRNVMDMLANVPMMPVDVVVTSVGLNDVLARHAAKPFREAQHAMLDQVQQRFSPSQVLITAVPPVGDFPGFPQPLRWVMHARRNWLDAELQRLCAEREACEYLALPGPLNVADMGADGFHPGPRIYALWAATAAARIRARFSAG